MNCYKGSLASQAGLIEGDLVTLINEVSTENLTNEQLRKVMRQRLQLNSIQMNLLTLKKLGKKIQSGKIFHSILHSDVNCIISRISKTLFDKEEKFFFKFYTEG